MSDFTAKDVKALRDATGAGMMDAKKALTEAGGDAEAATQILREKGLSKAAKRSDRDNTDGAVALAQDGDKVAVVLLRSETDFSAKSDDFVAVAQKLADVALAGGDPAVDCATDIEDLMYQEGKHRHRCRPHRRGCRRQHARHLPARAGWSWLDWHRRRR